MADLNDATSALTVEAPRRYELSDRYTFNQTWYEALLNTDMVLRTHREGQKIKLDPAARRQIVEIGVYEGASSCFWSDFYMSHPDSRLISIDPFTGSEEHHRDPAAYPELRQIELTARTNISKSDNAGKIDLIKARSWDVFPRLARERGPEPWIDLLYIDGAHDPTSVARDTSLYVPMVKSGGMVIFDDYGHPDVRRGVDHTLNAFASMDVALYSGWQLVCKVS